jgi:hypothetical protein
MAFNYDQWLFSPNDPNLRAGLPPGIPGIPTPVDPRLGVQYPAMPGVPGVPTPVDPRTGVSYPSMPGTPSVPTPVLRPVPMGTGAPPAAPVQHLGYGPNYNAPGKDMSTSGIGRYTANLLPEGVYQRFLNARGLGNQNSRLGQWSTNQYGRAQDLYKQAAIQSPGLSFDRFLKTGGMGKMVRDFLAMSPSARGAGTPTRTSSIMWG